MINNELNKILKFLVFSVLSKPTPLSPYLRTKIKRNQDNLFYLEQFTATQTFHKTISLKELQTFFESEIGVHYKNCLIETEENGKQEQIQILTNKKGKSTLLRRNLNKTSTTPIEKHNKEKNYLLKEGEPIPFLEKLGVMSSDGKVLAAKYDKFKQINRFLEFINDVLPAIKKTTNDEPIRIIDFGCGKSYLTFAVYHFLHNICNYNIELTGLDLKDDVIILCNKLSKEFGFNKLHFFCEDIASYLQRSSSTENIDMVIALHACDTATDYALASAIKHNAKVILSVPCCQHELNKKIDSFLSDKTLLNKNTAYDSFFKYGIIKERFAAMATDVRRAEILENHGYDTQILEFIDMSHTPKNLLIRAVKKDTTKKSPSSIKNELNFSLTLETLLSDKDINSIYQ